MQFKQTVTFIFILTALTIVQATAWAQPQTETVSENVVLRWNRVLKETIGTPGMHPGTVMPVRSYAMMHAAMFDAANSVDRDYTPYLVSVPEGRYASPDAAAAQAAHDVLAALYPSRAGVLAAELSESLSGIDPVRRFLSVRVGKIAAARMIKERGNDGWFVTPPAYTLPSSPGNWQPTPPSGSPAAFTHYGNVKPFAIDSAEHFAPAAPPAMTSARYTASFNEVKALGALNSTVRTADQTQVAKLWANVGTPTNFLHVWNNVAATVSEAKNLDTVSRARLFALINISLHDALQTTFASKFEHGLWRPVHAIQYADQDGNPDTEADPAWQSLIVAPPYPTYAGNMAAIGTSQATVLALFFGRDDIAYEHTWDGAGGATRWYPGFNAMADEQERARVYGGIHFTFDQEAGQSVGRNVGNYVFQNLMTPRGRGGR
jgi:hypothetical protein